MRYGVVVTRRFVDRSSGKEIITELSRAVELGIPPVPGMVLCFDDGTPEAVVSTVRHRVGTVPGFGVRPVEVELVCRKESALGLAAAQAAHWARLGDATAAPPAA